MSTATTTVPTISRAATTQRLLARIAAGGALAFAAATVVAGLLDPGYSPRSEAISALASLESDSAGIMIFGFLCVVVAALAAGVALLSLLPGKSGRAAGVLVIIAGAAMVIVGFARQSCSTLQQSCLDRESAGTVSDEHVIHNLVSLVVFVLLVIAGFLIAAALRRAGSTRAVVRAARIAAVSSLALMIWFGSAAFGDNGGLVQRAFILVSFGLPVVVALHLSRKEVVA